MARTKSNPGKKRDLNKCLIKRNLSKWSHQNYKSETTIEELPDECLIHILSFLPKSTLLYHTSLVTKRFHRLSMDPQLWKTLEFEPADHNIEKAKDVVQRARCLKELHVTRKISAGCSPYSYVNEIFKTGYLSATLKCLKVASRDEITLPQDFFQNLSNANVRLTDLKFQNAIFPTDTDQHLACLRDLDLIELDTCRGNIFNALSKICKNLTIISFQPAYDITPDEWSSFVKLISRNKDTLTAVFLREFNRISGMKKRYALRVLEPLSRCSNLEYLAFRITFYDNVQLTLNDCKLVGQMENLIYLRLDVYRHKNVMKTKLNCEEAEIVFGGKRLQKLKTLEINIPLKEKKVLNIIATNCPQLQSLVISMGRLRYSEEKYVNLLISSRVVPRHQFYVAA